MRVPRHRSFCCLCAGPQQLGGAGDPGDGGGGRLSERRSWWWWWQPGDCICTHTSLPRSLPAAPCQERKHAGVGVMELWLSLNSSGLTFLICKMGDLPDELEQ